MIQTTEYKGELYPIFQTEGNAAKFAIPFAQQICNGKGYDIGCNRLEWCMPGAIPIDPVIDPSNDALNLPDEEVDFIFSSHCLEHISDWVGVLDYWKTKIKPGGVLFLYLPHPDQIYWRPWNNRKHVHILDPKYIKEYLVDRGFKNVFVSERDLNHSFICIAEKI